MHLAKVFLKENYGLSHLKGFREICYTIDSKINVNDRNYYNNIANKFDSTPSRVERNIRHYRESVNIKKTNKEFLNDLFIEFEVWYEKNR